MGEQQKDMGTMTSGVLGSAMTGDQRAESAGSKQRLALQITSGILQALVGHFSGMTVFESRWTIRQNNGDVIANCTIAEALDMANEALEPSHAIP